MKKPNKTKQLLQQALGMNSEERTVLLEQINDPTLRSQLETLLADKNQQQDFLQKNTSTQATDRTDILSPGAKINRIRIEKMLGQGGMGSVYLGFDEKLERQVAVKSIRSEHLQNPATQQRFVREAQIMSKINHPSICQLYDYVETEQGDFLVMEYIEGQPLYKTPLTEPQKLQVLADLASALAVAHEHGVVHRDLKPDNIMITGQGQLKVLDFGIAQSLSQPKEAASTDTKNLDPALTQQGSLVGTIRYMSPEQAQGKTIQTASDMYAFGIIAQEVFSHEAAYQVLETNQLLTDVQQGKRKPVDLPAPVSQLIEQLTLLQPEERPSAEQTAEQLKAIQNAPKLKRKQLIKFSVAGAVLVLLGVLLWQWLQMGSQAERDLLIKDYEAQIYDLVKQSQQIYVLPIHPVDAEINQLLQQSQVLFGHIENDKRLTTVDKKRLQGIIMLKAEYYGQAISLLEQGEAENKLMAEAWSKLYVEKANEFSEEFGVEQTLKAQALQEEYFQPAMDYIEKTAKETGKLDPLHEAFVLSRTETLEAALEKANEILKAEQWNHAAVELKSMVLSAMMARAREQGAWSLAKTYAEQTVETYELSTQMARSYPVDYSNLCFVNMRLAMDAIQRTGQGIEHYFAKAKTACQNTLIIQPQNNYPMNLLSVIYMLESQWRIDSGQNASNTLSQAKTWNQKSKAINETFFNTWSEALILTTEAKQLMMQGNSVLPKIEQALSLFDTLLKLDTSSKPSIISDVLFVMSYQAHEQVRRGQPHLPTIEQAQTLFDEAMLKPNLLVSEQRGLVINMAEVLKVDLQLSFEQGSNQVHEKATKLIAFLDPNDNLIKDDPLQLTNLANAHFLLAKYLYLTKKPLVKQHLAKAHKYIVQAQQIHQKNYFVLLATASITSFQHLLSGQQHEDSNDLFETAILANPNNPYGYYAWSESLLLHANNQQSPTTQQHIAELALAKLDKALHIDPDNPKYLTLQKKIMVLKNAQSF